MEINLLPDTNVYSAIKRGHPRVVEMLRRAEVVVMSTVVVGELLYGFRHGTRRAENERELDDFLGRPKTHVVDVSRTTASRYARIAKRLRELGTPIPTNDIWIAAHAKQTGALLLSFDDHFSAVEGLVWEKPT